MKILIVEDDKNIREGVADFLSEFGYNTIEASDGREALAKFDEQDISLVILDIQMPYINGLEVLKEIRKRSKLPVLMLTAFGGWVFGEAFFITGITCSCRFAY